MIDTVFVTLPITSNRILIFTALNFKCFHLHIRVRHAIPNSIIISAFSYRIILPHCGERPAASPFLLGLIRSSETSIFDIQQSMFDIQQ